MKKIWPLIFLSVLLSACQQPGDFQNSELSKQASQAIAEGHSKFEAGNIDGAVRAYRLAMKGSEKSVAGHLALAQLYTKVNRDDEAIAILKKAKDRNATHPLVNLELAKISMNQDDAETALEFLNEGLDNQPNNLDLLNSKAVAMDWLAKHDEAQKLYLDALANSSDDTDFVKNNLAMSYIMTGDYEKAIKQLKSVETLEESPVMRQNLAIAYGLSGNSAKAQFWSSKDISAIEFADNLKSYRQYYENLKR